MPKILIIPGSVRNGSFNIQLAGAIGNALNRHGGDASVVSLADYDLPLLDQNFEDHQGTPENARKLAKVIAGVQGVVLVHPEYNSSLTPLMKNTLDWLSRDVGEKVYQNRSFALAACSPGGLGGIRVLSHARDILVNVGAEIITPQLAVGNAMSAFDDKGNLVDERAQGLLKTLCETLIERAGHHA